MRVKRKHFLVICLIASLSIVISGQINTAAEKFHNVEVNITEISWHPNNYQSLSNNTFFKIKAKFQVINQNNYNITLPMSYITAYYLVNVRWILDNTSLELIHLFGKEVCCMEGELTIAQGITNLTAYTRIGINKLGLTTLPDGVYTFWIYLFDYGETIFNSKPSRVIIENGIPTFQYKLTINLALQKNHLILLIIIASITMRYIKRRNRI